MGAEETSDTVCCSGRPEVLSLPVGCGVALPGVDHGEDTLGGFGSYVKIDAILSRHLETVSVQASNCGHRSIIKVYVRKEKVFVCE
jgi:hypothetical protein